MTKKKFAELELSLLHLQQNVEIPETHLIIHPVIQRTVEQVIHSFRFPRLLYLSRGLQGTSSWDTTEYLTNSRQIAKRQHVS